MKQEEFEALEAGDRIFWHSPEPPYALWYAVVQHRDRFGDSLIYVPATGETAALSRADQVHREVPRGCRFCMPFPPQDPEAEDEEDW